MRINPFIQTLAVPYIRIIKRDVPTHKTSLEERDYFEVEAQRHTRVYRDTERLKDILKFSVGGLRLYLWLIYSVRSSQQYIKIDEHKLTVQFECSGKQVQRMRQELIAAAVLAKKENNEYWINPIYFCAADRLKTFPENKVCVATRREEYTKPLSGYESMILD